MRQHLSEQERMPKDEIHLESRIWEIRTSGLVDEVKPKACVARRGFTLIELLVVIAIISILMAMLLPALRNAKKVTYSIVCKANLKQVALASLNYALDWNGRIPYAGTAPWDPCAFNDDGNGSEWYQKLNIYVKGSTGGTAMHCPQTTQSLTPRWIYEERCDFDFTANYNLTMNTTGGGWHCIGPNIKYLNATIFWYADGQFGTTNSGYYPGAWSNFSATSLPWMCDPVFPLVGKGHLGNSANFVFGDNHVDSLTRQGIADRTTGDGYDPASPYSNFNGWATPP